MKPEKSVSFITYGCKVNQFDTDKIISNLPDNFKVVTDRSLSDFCIINTCTVTDNTDNQFFKDLKKLKRDNPQIITLVTGCLAQTSPEKLNHLENIDLVVDNANKYLIPKVLSKPERYHKRIISNIFDIREFDDDFENIYENRSRAFLKVQDGCNYRCSFCIIPFARGRSRSLKEFKVIEKINRLNRLGYNEVVLTGIHLSSYGKDIGSSFEKLLNLIDKETDIPNIRLSSIDPADTSLDLIDLISSSKKICPSFHISLQSGDEEVLKNMRRRYKIEKFNELINYIRQKLPSSCIGTDVIVGFPGENNNLFNNTVNFIKNSELNYLHVFPYSDRKGTPASISKDKVDDHEKQKRSKILRELSNNMKLEFANKFKNIVIKGIKEKNNKVRTNNYIDVSVENSNVSQGSIVEVIINTVEKDKIFGTIVGPHLQ